MPARAALSMFAAGIRFTCTGGDDGDVSTLFLLVGLPGAGKTTRAIEVATEQQTIRMTPDEWMIPLFGEPEAGGKRDVLEGRLITLALDALAVGTNVVLDFGLWSRDERSALRWLAASVGATSRIIYLPIDREVQLSRVQERTDSTSGSAFAISVADLDAYRAKFEEPTEDELNGGEIDSAAFTGTWRAWAANRWPTLGA